jgi:hypothetical protein
MYNSIYSHCKIPINWNYFNLNSLILLDLASFSSPCGGTARGYPRLFGVTEIFFCCSRGLCIFIQGVYSLYLSSLVEVY